MNITKNIIPSKPDQIHMIAACGTGMGALAVLLKRKGCRISASDHQVYPPMSTFLANNGIVLAEGYQAANLSHDPDLVIVGNAVTRDNPEVTELMRRDLNYCSMPQAINHFVMREQRSIVVAGTHGKTTTASLIAWILQSAGCDPTFLIGGLLRNFDSNHRLGDGEFAVIEGDEYDSAFFDKVPKLWHYKPDLTILTSVEFDHADIYRDLAHVCEAFDKFIDRIPTDGYLLAFDGDKNVARLIRDRRCKVATYGWSRQSHWHMDSISNDASGTRFRVYRKGEPFGRFQTRMIGRHNLANILAAIAIADRLQIPPDRIQIALDTFKGIRRRQEVCGICRGITVIDDFAHHPTAVTETLKALRSAYDKQRLVAVFEPRTHASMRKVFQNDYAQAFDAADLICIRAPSAIAKIPPAERMSTQRLVADLNARGRTAHHFKNTQLIIDYLTVAANTGDVIAIMSNGGFDNIHTRLIAALERGPNRPL